MFNDADEALERFKCMVEQGYTPDARTYAAVLKACAVSAKFETGKRIHAAVCEAGLDSDWLLVHGLLEVYGKCGSMINAQLVFDSLNLSKDVVTYTTLLGGYSLQANSQRVLEVFYELESEEVQPDGVTLLCVLSACGHSGSLEKGRRKMRRGKYGVEPGAEHYHCMVDILGRGNRLDEALRLVEDPFKPSAVTWLTVLGACHGLNDVRAGRFAFERMLEFGEGAHLSAAYTLMRNLAFIDNEKTVFV